jgi:hypothetical protein
MGFVIIPFDYERLSEAQRRLIVPICIASADRFGNEVASIWFEKGVAPVQERLRDLARYNLRDVWRVSELAEITVHKLWERHGKDAGDSPWRRVWARAVWEARALAKGESTWRIKHRVPLIIDTLERELNRRARFDPTRHDNIYERELLLEMVERGIEKDHREDIRAAFQMLRQGYTWDEIATRLNGPRPEALKKRFWRWIRDNFK